jgi:fluoroacetyl-CoA thioesterase
VATSFESVRIGLESRRELVIDDSQLTAHVGGQGLFATPSMILLMEQVAHDAVGTALPGDHTTVGYEVCVRHLAPARAGERIVVSARLDHVTGSRLQFAVECTKDDGDTLVGTGTHKRAIIPSLA